MVFNRTAPIAHSRRVSEFGFRAFLGLRFSWFWRGSLQLSVQFAVIHFDDTIGHVEIICRHEKWSIGGSYFALEPWFLKLLLKCGQADKGSRVGNRLRQNKGGDFLPFISPAQNGVAWAEAR
jgi:hypothetical protein